MQERAIAALLECPTQAQAAQGAGVSLATLSNWLKKAEFQRGYREARTRVVEAAVGRLQNLTGAAVDKLGKLLESANENVAYAAAKTILEHSIKGIETADLLTRIEELERVAEARKETVLR